MKVLEDIDLNKLTALAVILGLGLMALAVYCVHDLSRAMWFIVESLETIAHQSH